MAQNFDRMLAQDETYFGKTSVVETFSPLLGRKVRFILQSEGSASYYVDYILYKCPFQPTSVAELL